MSGLMTSRRNHVQRHQETERDVTRCAANGCPLRGTIDRGNSGRYSCLCHDNADPRDWPRITHEVVEHQWLMEFCGDVLRMAQDTRPNAQVDSDWRAFAHRFWAGIDDNCRPTADEEWMPSIYVYRMLGEMRARVLGVDKPKPWSRTKKVANPQFASLMPRMKRRNAAQAAQEEA